MVSTWCCAGSQESAQTRSIKANQPIGAAESQGLPSSGNGWVKGLGRGQEGEGEWEQERRAQPLVFGNDLPEAKATGVAPIT